MSKAILLADDSVTIQKVIELTFMDQDYRIEAVSSGDEALSQLDGGMPDLVIADVHMPGGASGYEVARRAKEISPATPVLLLVGTFEPFDEGEFEASGADEVLKKPFDSQELLRLVEKLLPAQAAGNAPPAEVPAPPAGPENAASETDLEDTGVFSLDDDVFDGDSPEGSSQVLPPKDLAGTDAQPVAGSAWESRGPAVAEDEDEPPTAEADADDTDRGESDEAEDWEIFAERSAVDYGAGDDDDVEYGAADDEDVDDGAVDDDGAEPASAVPASAVQAPAEPDLAQPTPVPFSLGPDEPEEETDDGGEDAAAEDDEPAPGLAEEAGLSDEDVERIAVRVAQLLGEKVSRDIAWEVIPDLAEVIIKERLRELESQVE